jgi:hypothetical protein
VRPNGGRHWQHGKTRNVASFTSAKSSASRHKPEGSRKRGSERKARALQKRPRSPENAPPSLSLPQQRRSPHKRTRERRSRPLTHSTSQPWPTRRPIPLVKKTTEARQQPSSDLGNDPACRMTTSDHGSATASPQAESAAQAGQRPRSARLWAEYSPALPR